METQVLWSIFTIAVSTSFILTPSYFIIKLWRSERMTRDGCNESKFARLFYGGN